MGIPELWWSPAECSVYADREGAAPHYLTMRDTKHFGLPLDAVQLVGPDQRRPIVELRADDCDCRPPYADCPHGPEPVDVLDLAVWLHAEALWFLERKHDEIRMLHRQWFGARKTAHERTAERDALQSRIDAAHALTEPHPLRHWDTQWPIRAALEGMTAAEYTGAEDEQDARTASSGPTAQGNPGDSESTVDTRGAALQGDQPAEPDERLAGMARPAEGVQLIADAFGIAPAEAAAQLRAAIRAAARSDLDEPGQPTGEADRG